MAAKDVIRFINAFLRPKSTHLHGPFVNINDITRNVQKARLKKDEE